MRNKRSKNFYLSRRDSVNWKGKVLHMIIKTYAKASYLKSKYPSWHCGFCVHTLWVIWYYQLGQFLWCSDPSLHFCCQTMLLSFPWNINILLLSSCGILKQRLILSPLVMHCALHSTDLFICSLMLSSAFSLFFSNTKVTGGLVFLKSQKL